ncbi:MAG TPA: CbiX/SirB N-terminal domain-containing protein [Gemmataceae bacterium]|nr:CbiX/SirB N-terminal domain-containing protein [Gemmataceae bacterium]
MHSSPDDELLEAASRKTALLLIAHGSREENANADLYEMVEHLRKQKRYAIVEASFLELAQPDIAEGGKRCVERGAERVILLPYFLSAGVHVTRDLTQACRTMAAQHPGIAFRLAEPLGRHPLLLQIITERARAAENQF